MNILFWINKFPTFSETFIRDQIINLIDNGMDVSIYSGPRKDFSESDALKGFEKFNLKEKVIDEVDFLPSIWRKRKVKHYQILLLSIFNGNYKYYKRALNEDRFGEFSKSFRLFYYVHYLLKNKIQIIHAHFGTNGLQASIFKELGLPLKLITTFHGFDIRLGMKNEKSFYKPLFKNADKIIAISKFNKEHLMEFGLEESKIVSLPNGIDTNFFKKTIIKPKSEKIQIITVARLVEEKSLGLGITAISKLLIDNQKLQIEYSIIGEGELKKELLVLIKNLNLEKHVKLLGSKTTLEVKNAMINADVFLLTSKVEVLPTVLLEAQACELPIVATDVGSVKEMVVNGIIVKPNSLDDLVIGLTKIINMQDEWLIMGNDGRNFIAEKFNIKKITKSLIEIYNE